METIALSAAGDYVVPPPSKTEPTEPQREVYQWISCLREWVSAPPIWLGATPQQEEAYLLHWKLQRLSAERTEGLRQMALEKEAEEERWEMEEEERARAREAQTVALWNKAFPLAGPAPTLTSPAPTMTTTPRAAS
ncbi:Pre-mRNA-processing factor 39 [Hordeum vulgare]|nr:Pre-mRNA-processing factor 39 [Hordeum vulgare]